MDADETKQVSNPRLSLFMDTLPLNSGKNRIVVSPPNADFSRTPLGLVRLIGMVLNCQCLPFIAEADVNEDGIVNFLDISPFIGTLASAGT